MSKTDKHKPFRAQMFDSHVEYHDHSKGECDLLPLDEWKKLPRREEWRKHCGYQPTNWHTYKGFKRNKGEGEWIATSKGRKNKDWKDNYDY